MDEPAESLIEAEPRRPRDLALLLLAIGTGAPRARARDQQADRAGLDLRRRVLDRLAALDPEPRSLDETLTRIIAEFGEPTGPTRGVCAAIRDEWIQANAMPRAWSWLLQEALEISDRDRAGVPVRRRSRGDS
jgi:hypothetical protein